MCWRGEAPAQTPTEACGGLWLAVRSQARGSHTQVPTGTHVPPHLCELSVFQACGCPPPFPAVRQAWGGGGDPAEGPLKFLTTYRCDDILPWLAWSDSDRLNAPIKLDPILKSLSWIYF